MKFLVLFTLACSSAVSFAAQIETCPNGETWVAAHPRKEYQRKDGTFVSASFITGHCRTKNQAYDFWASQFSNDQISTWPNKSEKMKAWRRQEIEMVLRALESVPEKLWEKVKLHRSNNSLIENNPSSLIDKSIVLYDKAFENPKLLGRYLVHELSHQLYFNMSVEEKSAFNKIAMWKRDDKGNLRLMRPKTVAPDSDVGPDEDFANNLEYFLFEPIKLQFKDRTTFDWFREKYGDKIKLRKGDK